MVIHRKQPNKTRRQVRQSLDAKMRMLNEKMRGGTNAQRITISPEEMREWMKRARRFGLRKEEFEKARRERKFIKEGNEQKIAKGFGKFLTRAEARVISKPTLESNTELLKEMIRKEKEEDEIMLAQARRLVKEGLMEEEVMKKIRESRAREHSEMNELLRKRLELLKKRAKPLTEKELIKERESLLGRIERAEREIQYGKKALEREAKEK